MPEETGIYRSAYAAGRFFSDSPERLSAEVMACLAEASPCLNHPEKPIIGILVPHAGYVYSGRTAAYAYACLEGRQEYRSAVLLGASHSAVFSGISIADCAGFSTPLGRVDTDVACCRALREASPLFGAPSHAHECEHALEVQLPFLQTVLPDLPIVPLLCGHMRRDEIAAAAKVLVSHLGDSGNLWIVSSDFTHHGRDFAYCPFSRDVFARIRELDEGAMAAVTSLDWCGLLDYVADTGATICGATAIALFLAMLESRGCRPACEILDHSLSGEMLHDPSHSVSYVSAIFQVEDHEADSNMTVDPLQSLSVRDRQRLLELARESILDDLLGRDPVVDREYPPDDILLRTQFGCFVTIYVDDVLHGCMGCVEPIEPLWETVREEARQAAFMDPRFHPLSVPEATRCRIEITLLTPPQPIHSVQEYEPGRHGILLTKGTDRSVFLPEVPVEHGWEHEETLERLAVKAGLPQHAWRQAQLAIFQGLTIT